MTDQRLNVLPTKMQLMALRQRYSASQRGHSLLKKKLDAMTLQLRSLNSQLVTAREAMVSALKEANWSLTLAQRSVASGADLYSTLFSACETAPNLTVHKIVQNVAGVRVSSFTLCDFTGKALEIRPDDPAKQSPNTTAAGLTAMNSVSLGFSSNQGHLNETKAKWIVALSAMVAVAGLQRSCADLTEEVKVTSRRVNAIEYILLPKLDNTIKWITDSLEETEREEFARIKKVADGRRDAAEAERQQGKDAEPQSDLINCAVEDPDIMF